MTNIKPSKPHNPLMFFEDKEDMQAYLNVCIEEYLETGDFKELGKSLEILIKVQGKVSTFSERTEIARQHLYTLFRSKKEPKFYTMLKILKELGFKVNITMDDKKTAA